MRAGSGIFPLNQQWAGFLGGIFEGLVAFYLNGGLFKPAYILCPIRLSLCENRGRSQSSLPADGNPSDREAVVAQGQMGDTLFFVERESIVTQMQSAEDIT